MSYNYPKYQATILDERYEHVNGGVNFYWEIRIVDKGTNHNGFRYIACVKYSKGADSGMYLHNEFTSAKACKAWAAGKIREKLDKGYVKVTPQQTLQAQASKTMIVPQLKQVASTTAQSLFDSMPVGIAKEVVVTIIVCGEIIQETVK